MVARTTAQRVWQYDAFISYNHAADRTLATAVQRCLHRLARPWYRTQALRVFRDETSLAANPNLWKSIEDALTSSRYFILLASPRSASSVWIQREVAYWREHRDRATFLIALTDGELQWDDEAGDFDWTRTDALPQELRGWFNTEPLWADLRWTRGQRVLSPNLPNLPRFRGEVATLAAAVHGVPKDRLESGDIRERRRARWMLAFLGVVLLALTGGLGYTLHLRNRQQEIAVAADLHAKAEKLRDSQPQTALRLDLAAYALDPTAQARAGLVTTLVRTHYAGATPGPTDQFGVPAFYLSPIRFGGAGHLVTGIGDQNKVPVWDISDPDHPVRLPDLTGNTEYLNDVAISTDGRTVAIASRDDTISLWEISDGAPPRRITLLTHVTGEKYGVEGVAFSHDGTTLAAVGRDGALGGTVALWTVTDLAHPVLLGSQNGVYDTESVAFSPNDQLLVTASGTITANSDDPAPENIVHTTGVTLWDLRDRGRPKQLERMPLWSAGIEFSPDGLLLGLGYNDTAVLWNLANPSKPVKAATLAGHTEGVESVAFSPDGRTLATGSFDNTAILWDISDTSRPARLSTLANNRSTVGGVRFSADGKRVITVEANGTITDWRVNSPGQPVRQAAVPTQSGTFPAPTVAVSPDGRMLASADGFAGTVTVWNVSNLAQPTKLATLTPDLATVQTVAFNKDGTTLAAGGANGRIVLWDMTDRARPREVATITATTQVTFVAFDPTRAVLLANGAADPFAPGWTTLWDVRDPTHPTRLTLFSDTGGFDGAPAFSPDGATLVLPGDVTGKSSFWDIRDPATPVAIPYGNDTPAGTSGSVSNQPVFGPNRGILASVSRQAVVIWDVGDPSHALQLGRLTGHTGDIKRVAFAPTGNIVATASDDHTTMLWDLVDPGQPVQIAALTGQTGKVTDVVFAPGGGWLATASDDKTVMIWSLGDLPAVVAADPIAMACQVADGGLTPAQWQDYAPDISPRDSCP